MFSKYAAYIWGIILLLFAGCLFAKEMPGATHQNASTTVLTEDDYTLVTIGNFTYWVAVRA